MGSVLLTQAPDGDTCLVVVDDLVTVLPVAEAVVATVDPGSVAPMVVSAGTDVEVADAAWVGPLEP